MIRANIVLLNLIALIISNSIINIAKIAFYLLLFKAAYLAFLSSITYLTLLLFSAAYIILASYYIIDIRVVDNVKVYINNIKDLIKIIVIP